MRENDNGGSGLKTPGIEDLYRSRNCLEFCDDLRDFVAGRSLDEQMDLLGNDEFFNLVKAALANADERRRQVLNKVLAVFDESMHEDLEDLFS